jgi:hypothetical protein
MTAEAASPAHTLPSLIVDRAGEGVGILVGIAFALPALIFAAMVVLRAW